MLATALCVGAWGFFLYQGVTDPLGGVNTLWPLFGISNQMLAAVALTLCTVVIFRMKRERYAWVTILPTLWLVACTLTAGIHRLRFATAAYFEHDGRKCFYPEVAIVFEVTEPHEPHHVPLLLSPFGYSTYRGS